MADREHFDTAVVGSGFGGSVTAFRLAEQGRSVCLLERGRAYPPGTFPRTPREMARNFWDPGQGLYGLFDIWSFRAIEAVVASGLGGGSLIYANVLLRKDERWFAERHPPGGTYEPWPIDRADLEPYYDRVERMLGGQRYPIDAEGYADTPKTHAMHEAARRLGLAIELPPLAVTFTNDRGEAQPGTPIAPGPYPNLHGPRTTRMTCRMCGECDLGCNSGSKNTLDHTYLSAAAHHGAEIRTRCEVRRIEPRPGGGFGVSYVRHSPDREGRRTAIAALPHETITADRLILAAGTLGTTSLLLRNRSALPGLSTALGTRFSGNGDVLGFMMRAQGGRMQLDPSRGPVITAAIRVPDALDGDCDGDDVAGRGHYVEDGGYPAFLDWVVEATGMPGSSRRAAWFMLRRRMRRLLRRLRRSGDSTLSAELSGLLGSAALSSSSMPLLGMGRDVGDGVMRLRDGHLDIDWDMRTSKSYFAGVRATMAQLSAALGARLHPCSATGRLITVHPLGGVPMGRHPRSGVVDAYGEVFGHPGLYVADGSVMPGPVGTNPALTIAAFADRLADHILEPRGRRLLPVAAEPPSPKSRPTSRLQFTEEMSGHITLSGHEWDALDCRFRLTIAIDDIDRFVTDPAREATADGWVQCEELGGRLPVRHGRFNLLVEDAENPRVRWMRYRLFFADGVGHPLTLAGFKHITDDPGFDVWSDTTTLFTRVLRGHVDPRDEGTAEVVATGVLRIHMTDFAKQLTTFRVDARNSAARAVALARFGQLFLGTLWEVYGSRLDATPAP
ncbi:MAG: FAD-dependent oxidoreductase [Egibacteraceae bacterium]